MKTVLRLAFENRIGSKETIDDKTAMKAKRFNRYQIKIIITTMQTVTTVETAQGRIIKSITEITLTIFLMAGEIRKAMTVAAGRTIKGEASTVVGEAMIGIICKAVASMMVLTSVNKTVQLVKRNGMIPME